MSGRVRLIYIKIKPTNPRKNTMFPVTDMARAASTSLSYAKSLDCVKQIIKNTYMTVRMIAANKLIILCNVEFVIFSCGQPHVLIFFMHKFLKV